MSSLDYLRRKRFINAVVQDTKMKFVEGDRGQYVGHDTIHMPKYGTDFTEEQDHHYMSELLNKCYHSLPDNRQDCYQGLKPEELFTEAFNITARHNAQNKRQGILPGADKYMEHDAMQDGLNFVQALNNGANIPPELEAVKAFDIAARSKWQTGNDFNVREHLSEEGQKMYDNMLNDDSLLSDYMEHREGGKPNVEMTKRLIEEATQDEERAQELQEQAQSGDGDGEDEQEGQGSGGENGEDQSGKSKSQKGQKGEGDGEEKGPSDEAEYDPLHKHLDGFNVNEIGSNQTIKYPDKDFGTDYKPMTNRVKKPEIGKEDSWGGNPARESDVRSKMQTTLSKKVRNILKVFSQARYRGGKKKGKINKRVIASITTGNDRIFRQKEKKDVLDTSVMLLVDTSGSMCGSRYSHAIAATAMLNDCLGKLNIPHAIYGFTCDYDHNIMYEHKTFNQSRSVDEVIGSMCSGDVAMSGNDDGDSVLFAHDKLIQQKQKRKILIVLSDGQPTQPRGGDARRYLKMITEDIEKKSPVELYGIGIETDCVKQYYSNSVVINHSNELEEKLLSIIKSSIIE